MAIQVSEDRVKTLKLVLIGLNILLFVAGLGLLGGSIFLYIDKSDLLTYVYLMKVSRPACVLVLSAVSLAIATAVLGGLAAAGQRKILLIVYCGLVLLAGLVVGAGLGCAVTGKVKWVDFIRWRMRDVLLKNYGVDVGNNTRNAFLTKKWDEAQRDWYCCGIEDSSWGVYRSSKWFELQEGNREYDRPLVPPSCCTYNQYGTMINLQKCQTWMDGPPRKQSGPYNEALLYRGCYTHGTSLLQRVSIALIIISIILIFILIACLSLSILMLIGLRTQESKQAIIRQTAYSVSKKNPTFEKTGVYNSSYA